MADGQEKFGVISGTWMGVDMPDNQYLSGTWTDLTAPATIWGYNTAGTGSNAWFLNLVVSDSYANHCWHRFAITINNNLESRCRSTGGIASNWDLIAPTVTVEIDIPLTSATYKIFGHYQDGTLSSFAFGNWDSVGTEPCPAVGDIQFNAGSCEMTANPFTYDGGFEVLRLTFNVLYDAVNNRWGGATVTDLIQIADGLDQTF